MSREEPKWRIDAMDARGGLAFAAWRTNHFPEADAAGSPPSVFIGAPAFQPEMIANRSIAMAAVRGAFQHRLYIGDDEVAFPTLASVVEFVRRVYLRGGGGDGADGTGGRRPSPLLPSLERPLLPETAELDREPASLVSEMLHAAAMFAKESHSCPPGSIAMVGWPAAAVLDPEPAKQGTDAALANAAVVLICEIMRRMPDGRDLTTLVRWHEDARRLGYAFAVMGLWPVLGGDPWRSAITKLLMPLREWEKPPAALTSLDKLSDDQLTCFLCSLFFGDGPGLDIPENTARFLDLIKNGGWSSKKRECPIFLGAPKLGVLSNPMSDLSAFALPGFLCSAVRGDALDQVSLYHALVSAVGCPMLLTEQTFCEVVLFAATWVVVHRDRPIFGAFERRTENTVSKTESVSVQLKADRGWNWLAEHLPVFCFNEKVEQIIDEAAKLKYELAPPAAFAA